MQTGVITSNKNREISMRRKYVKVSVANQGNHQALTEFFRRYIPTTFKNCTFPDVTDHLSVDFTDNLEEGLSVFSKDKQLVYHKKSGVSVNRVVKDMKENLSKNMIVFIGFKTKGEEKQLRIVL